MSIDGQASFSREPPSSSVEGGVPRDRSSKGEAESAAINAENLQRIEQQTSLSRHLHRIGIFAIYALAIMAGVRISHLVLPSHYHWLDADAQSDLLLVIVSVLSSWAVSYYFASEARSGKE